MAPLFYKQLARAANEEDKQFIKKALDHVKDDESIYLDKDDLIRAMHDEGLNSVHVETLFDVLIDEARRGNNL